ncbi:DNA repair protein xrcc3 [Haplosporangium sp. Z 11]|nr:DNA repair protein xrcc3 [Haplosporangium sp. Z 11]
MTSINVLELPSSIEDILTKDTVEDLLLYTPPSLAYDVPSARFKRHQGAKGTTSRSNYDRLMNLTPDEITLAYDRAAEYVVKERIAYKTALDLLQEENWLSLGDPILNDAVGGSGFMTHGITEIAGESAVGKTQLCLQLCLTVQLPLHMGGLDGSAVWLSTEGKLPYNRLESMIGHFVSKHKAALPTLEADEIRQNIYFDDMPDQESQLQTLNYHLPILIDDSHQAQKSDGSVDSDQESENQPRKKPVKLIVIDSITNNFRSELTISTSSDQSGNQGSGSSFRESILQRSSELCEIGLRLRALADQYGLTVICVNQVTDVFQPDTALLPSSESSVFDAMKLKKPALGLVWENTINARVVLQRSRLLELQDSDPYAEAESSEPQRTLSVIFAPWTASSSNGSDSAHTGYCQYRIDETGVVGVYQGLDNK